MELLLLLALAYVLYRDHTRQKELEELTNRIDWLRSKLVEVATERGVSLKSDPPPAAPPLADAIEESRADQRAAPEESPRPEPVVDGQAETAPGGATERPPAPGEPGYWRAQQERLPSWRKTRSQAAGPDAAHEADADADAPAAQDPVGQTGPDLTGQAGPDPAGRAEPDTAGPAGSDSASDAETAGQTSRDPASDAEAGPDEAREGRGPSADDGPSKGGPRTAASEDKASSDKAGLDFETLIGTTWLLRIGLGILAIALALFARSFVPLLPAFAKVALAYLGSIAFVGAGKYFEDRLEQWARPVMAGGLVFGFFVAFAAHFVPAMQAVSLPVSVVWMVVSMLVVLIAAERWQSESTAILAIILGHISAQVTAGTADTYSLIMIGALAVVAIVLLLRNQWVRIGLLGVLLSYGSHLLWVMADRQVPDGDSAFWLSVAFLTSYYVIFLIADVLWWHRFGDEAPDETEEPAPADGEADEVQGSGRGAQAASGGASVLDELGSLSDVEWARGLGPINLMMYVSLTTYLYILSGASVGAIEWYFLTLGALQGALAWFYAGVNHRDFVYYPIFGTVLWTLGMFAAFDALALNLILSAQAILLLIAARRTDLRVFYWLAQVAMAVAFVHYLVYPHPPVSTLAAFVGGLATAAVYLTKAHLEEDWFGSGSLVAPIHAIIGGALIAFEAQAYFGTTNQLGYFLGVAQLLIVAFVLYRGRATALASATTISVAALLFAPSATSGAMLAVLGALVVSALALVWLGPSRIPEESRKLVRWQSQAIAFSILLSAGIALTRVDASAVNHFAWAALLGALLAFQWRWDEEGNKAPPESWVSPFMYVGVGVCMVLLTGATIEQAYLRAVVVGGWSLVVLATALRLRAVGLALSGYTILLGGYAIFLAAASVFETGIHPTLASVWAGAFVALVPLVVAVFMDRTLREEAEEAPIPPAEEPPDSFGAATADDASEHLRLLEAFASIVPALLGLLLVGAYVDAQLPLGWHYLIPALTALVLLRLTDVLQLRDVPLAAIVAVALQNAHFILVGAQADVIATPYLLFLLAFVVVTLTVERHGQAALLPLSDDAVRIGLVALVILTTLTGMGAVYFSELVGAQWATAGWSVLGGSLMAAGFWLKASTYRRVALGLLGICVIRVFVVDTIGMSDTARIGAFFVLGLILVAIALLYTKYSEQLKSWL